MNLKILWIILIYYIFIIAFFSFSGDLYKGYSNDISLNNSKLSSSEIDKGGIFSTGVSITRFVGLVTIGIGLPSDTPVWFSLIFALWQSAWTIFTVGFVISSIWNG